MLRNAIDQENGILDKAQLSRNILYYLDQLVL